MSIAEINRRLEENYKDDGDDDDDGEEEDDDSKEENNSDSDEEDQEKEIPKWNSFEDNPHESESFSMADNPLIDASIQIFKLLAYLVTFLMVLVGAVCAKLILLLMTSQLTPDRLVTVACGSMTLALKLPNVEKYLWVWALLICFSAPEIWTLIRSVRMAVFKGYENEDDNFESENNEKSVAFKYIFIVTAVMEGLHVIGVVIFVFEILPQIDVAKGVMLTNCTCLVPGLLSTLSNLNLTNLRKTQITGDILAILFQVTGFFVWPVLSGQNNIRVWLLPMSLALISCGWWINYVSEESPIGFVKFLVKIKDALKDKNIIMYKLYIGISVWKILLFFGGALFVLSCQGTNIFEFFEKTEEAFSDREMIANEVDKIQRTFSGVTYPISSIGLNVWWVIGAQIASAYVCYVFGKFACKIMIQPFSFAFPCALVVPVALIVIVVATGLRNQNLQAFSSFLPGYLFLNSPQIYDVFNFFFVEYGWVWMLWIISQLWITFHIWMPRCERLSETEALFATPMYSGFFVDQSMTMNRRRDKIEIRESTSEDISPHIIACATMWHEHKSEMLEMLKSLLRMDNDQCLRRCDKIINPDDLEVENNYYTFESHIFFDDAFELENEVTDRTVMNKFVKNFLKIINKATKDVYGTDDVWIKPPLKYSTPYGGRLEYTLPGDNKLYVHLKDKDKIRHKKRWSQVMYMYYLLGFKLMEQNIPHEQIMNKAKNTYLMALDGDIDFKPDAVLLLVDLMKKNKSLGAACGRIHPVGSGLMVWYQLFEYAIGHWLQKSTEHMIGCVLCSPGCFSLFRAKALMSPNVMKRYTTKAEEAKHYVQYDQGEDRWLCTLLLQRGYRVEYSAASDAYTHCPETFDEFYNQRRRWIPSTVANIIDLLNDYKRTVRVNNSISMPYIVYQMVLLTGTILGPGTILLMLVGAFNSAFKIDNWTALYYNLIPIAAFILCCLYTSGKFQLSAALIISLMYGLVMMAVLVGIIMEISDDGILSPSSLFLFITAFEIIVAGVFHPQEFFCLFCGVIYYVTIPSMYLLLIIYSVCNLNVISWGTREVAKKKTKADLENEKKEAELAEKKAEKNKLLGIFDTFSGGQKKEKSLGFSFSSVFNCLCCTDDKKNQTEEQFVKIGETLNVIKTKMDNMERNMKGAEPSELNGHIGRMSINPKESIKLSKRDNVLIKNSEEEDDKEIRDDLFNPYWIEDKCLKDSKFEVLTLEENKFWIELIKKYLSPLNPDAQKEKEISKNLKDLRDKMVVSFFMLNALFVVVVFLLQVNKDQIHIKWPLGAKANITFNTITYEITIQKTYLQLEPVGLVFISFFASILVVQFLAMLFHRFETLCHLLSNTPLTLWKGKKNISYREKLDFARKKYNRQKQEQNQDDVSRKSFPDEKLLQTNEGTPEKRKSKANVNQIFQDIFTEMKEEKEEAEKIERRRSSLLPWKRNSIQPNRLSKVGSVVNLKLPKIEEESFQTSRV